MAYLELQHVSKGFGEGPERTDVLADVNLAVDEGEFIAIVGFYIYRVATFDRSHTRAETTDDSPR